MGRFSDFLDDRLGVVTLWRQSMSGKRPPRGIGWLRTLGYCALTVAILQLLSGIALALHYVPTADLAYDSILALEQDVPLGAFVRSLHHLGASAFVIFAVLHLLRVFFTGAYKQPREFTWITGVLLLLVVLGFGFTGYLLPWDQKAYFATKVGTQIAGKSPLIGEQLRAILSGGDTVGPPTLTRFYIIHVVLLPLALLGLLALHFYLIQRHGVAAPGLPVGDEGEPGPPYFPNHVFKEVLAGLLVAAALFGLAASFHAPLEAMAEPSDTGYVPRPDWYFLGLFELLKLFKGPLETVGTIYLPGLVVTTLLLLPFLDRSPQRHWRKRPLVVTLGIAIAAFVAVLTGIGALDQPTNAPVLHHQLGLTNAERQGYLFVRRLKCIGCHAYPISDGVLIGGSKDHPDAPYLNELDSDPDEISAILDDPKGVLDEDTPMPSFHFVPHEQRRAIGLYLIRLAK